MDAEKCEEDRATKQDILDPGTGLKERDGHNSLTPAEQQSHTSTIKIPNSEDGKLLEKRFTEERRTQGMKRQEFQGSIIYTNSSCSTHGPSKAVPSNETVEEIQAKAINAYLDWKHRKREMNASS